MKKLNLTWPFYTLLLPMFYVFHHFNELPGFIPAIDLIMALLASMGFMACCFYISFLFSRSKEKAALLGFLITGLVLYFGSYHDFMKSIAGDSFLSSYKLVLPLALLLITLCCVYFFRRSGKLKGLTIYLNTLMIVLIALELVLLMLYLTRPYNKRNFIYSEKTICSNFNNSDRPDSTKPDIYFLVFDGYTSNETLEELWQYNNDSISIWLNKMGFRNLTEAKANYNFTTLSLTSTFNMNYVDSGSKSIEAGPNSVLRGVNSLSENETFCVLKKQHYKIRFLAPFNNRVEENGLYHEFADYPYKELYTQTLPVRFQHDVLWNFTRGKYRLPGAEKWKDPTFENFKRRADDVPITIEKIKASANDDKNRAPQFVYGHFMITHQPHLFDSSGELRKGNELLAQRKLFVTYVQQVKFANKVILELVEHIRKYNRKNTIIIIQGDHGFRDLPPSLRLKQFSIFNSIYFPNQDYNDLYPQMSPVNTFRIVFNHYFGQNLPLLRDSSIFVKF